METEKTKPLDCYLNGVSTRGVEASRNIAGIRGAGSSSDAARKDAFEESAKGTGYRPNGDDKARDLAAKS